MEVVGGVAAALQLANVALQGLIKIYSLAIDIKEVPKSLQDALGDLEAFIAPISNLQKEVAQPGSRFARAPESHIHGLVASLKATAVCADHLKTILIKALPSETDSKIKRTWRAFASLSREHDILTQCDRLQNLKNDIHLHLQNVGLSLISLTNSSLEDFKAQYDPGGSARLATSLDMVTTKLASIEDSNTRIETLAHALHRIALSELKSGPALISETLRIAQDDGSFSAVNGNEMKQAAIECCRQLAKYPTDLANADNNSTSARFDQVPFSDLNSSEIATSSSNLARDAFCCCTNTRAILTRSFGPLKVKSTYTTLHDPSCPIFSPVKATTSHAIKASLRPFINKTIELVFQSSFGAGGLSRSQSVKCYNIVSRQLSPAFQLFDRINFLGCDNVGVHHLKALAKKQEQYSFERNQNGPGVIRSWLEYNRLTYEVPPFASYADDDIVALLDTICNELEKMFQSGASLPTDRDEFGNTLMHELIFTWQCFGIRSADTLNHAMKRLVTYLHQRGIDLRASAPVFRSYNSSDQTLHFIISSTTEATVTELGYYALFEQLKCKIGTKVLSPVQMPIPFNLLSDMGIELDSSFLGRYVEGVERIHRRSCLLDIASKSQTRDIVYDLRLSSLHHAVLQRSIDRVTSLMKGYPPEMESSNIKHPFSVVECALGWTEGVKLLSAAGYSVYSAIQLCIFRKDLASLKQLLSESDLSESERLFGYALCLDCHCHRSVSRRFRTNKAFNIWPNPNLQQTVMDLFVDTIKSRRQQLGNLARTRLPTAKYQSLELDDLESDLLDAKAGLVAQVLEDCGVQVPISLKPGDRSIFNSFQQSCPEGGIRLADRVYRAGFRQVDTPSWTQSVSPPLQKLALRIFTSAEAVDWSGPSVSAMKWLVDHGAATDVGRLFGWGAKPLLHGLAEFYDGYPVRQWDYRNDNSLFWERKQSPQRDIRASANSAPLEDSVMDAMTDRSGLCSKTGPSVTSSPQSGDSMNRIVEGAGVVRDGLHETDRADTDGTQSEFSETTNSIGGDSSDESEYTRSQDESDPGRGYANAETRPRRDLLQAVASGYTSLGDRCICYCSTSGCLPTHKLPILFNPVVDEGNMNQGSVKSWKQIQNNLFSWISDTANGIEASDRSLDSRVKVYRLEGPVRLEIFERLGMAHTCCHGETIINVPDGPTMSAETRKELQEEDAEAKAQLDLFMKAFNEGMAAPQRRLWSTRRIWRYWWDVVDQILPPLLPWERGMRYCVPVSGIPSGIQTALLNISADRHRIALEGAGYYPSDMDFVDVVRMHLQRIFDDLDDDGVGDSGFGTSAPEGEMSPLPNWGRDSKTRSRGRLNIGRPNSRSPIRHRIRRARSI